MSLKDDMDALEDAISRGPDHARFFRFGVAARHMMSPDRFAQVVREDRERLTGSTAKHMRFRE